ncbi:MAG: hypothetical protein K2P58_01250 [Hyphomonadaceae bacterium]|nr:hypothetical protein [Hyphomonadaceae bacterium]
MSQPETKNPEHRSSNAMLCFCLGVGLIFLAQFLGMGTILGAAMSGADPAVAVGSIFALIGIALMGVSGFVLAVIGGVWMFLRVVADQRGGDEKRYRDVER